MDEYKLKKILLVILPDKKKSVEKFSGFYLPRVIKNPIQISEHYKDIPIKYENLIINNGVVEHTFSLYRDYANKNLLYLIQNHPLQFVPTNQIFENVNVGLYYNTNKIIFDYLYEVVQSMKHAVVSEGVDGVFIIRFEMIGEQNNYFKFISSNDLYSMVPRKVGFFQGYPANGQIHIKDSIHSLNLLLFSALEQRKVLIDFYFSYLNIFRFYNGYPVKISNPDEFLDKVFNDLRSLFLNILTEKDDILLSVSNDNEKNNGGGV